MNKYSINKIINDSNNVKDRLKKGHRLLTKHLFNFFASKAKVKDQKDDFLNDEIRLRKSFISQSGASIDNKDDGVFINGKDFQAALANYFDKGNKKRVMAESIHNIQNKVATMKTVYDLGKAVHDLDRSDEELELLNRSRILQVYAVLKGKHGNESLLWGLAEDRNNPEKRFHWFTDLKRDVSVLMNKDK